MADVVNLTDAITAAVRGSGGRVFDAVVEELVAAEVEQRKKLLLQALTRRDELTKKLNAVKPRPQFFDSDHKPVGEPVFTAQQNDERRKMAEALKTLESAVNTALTDPPNFEPLKKAVAGGGGD